MKMCHGHMSKISFKFMILILMVTKALLNRGHVEPHNIKLCSEQDIKSSEFQSTVNNTVPNLTDSNESKIINQISTHTNQVITSASDTISESAASIDIQNIGISSKPTTYQQNNPSSTKKTRKSNRQTDQDQSINSDDDDQIPRQRSLSSSSSTSTLSSESSSTDNIISNIPYEVLHNEEDGGDEDSNNKL